MSAQDPSPLPPTTIISSKPISQSIAHDFLAAYLDRATTDPALQPNAGISEHGPVSRTTAAAPNLILHNLKRVQAGLAGEVLGRDLALAKLKEGLDAQQQSKDATAGETGQDGWEDAKQFEQGVDTEGVAGSQELMDVDKVDADASGRVDKEERKRKKKERRQAEKRAKAQVSEE
ncbi:hypothetical protein P175DRAFT_0498058 [Aspergillus ochraceoroseus IBT 24754]|uniref:Uncharacterized protein n=2 Tax=Aspergillus ochraceoroseus TaxID=138278 RepID=A0A2T5M8W3_9EURO|nr:uncharacterized protein P175DRAFT_0498058 [Aspergillus ochraceoroseus IBT 24754]KKK17662.1 hypothetical protein AOCH_002482 [Aspergillus ochraceoroseus]PTU24955.1 hypothetical protein P175DRAFT_0498058 [Aspergillus ochraceoroseus IBT 24754]